jgi:hypothetical protein
MGDFRDSHVDILTRVTVALNTDLEGAITELDMTHRELQNAQARIASWKLSLQVNSHPRKQKHLVLPGHPHARGFVMALQQRPLIFVRLGV